MEKMQNKLADESNQNRDKAAACEKIIQIIDIFSLAVFFAVFILYDIFVATGALMAVVIPMSLVAFLYYRVVPKMQVFMLLMVVVFGGLTLYFNDAAFIKVKPTITLSAFAAIAFASVILNKPILRLMIPDKFIKGALHDEMLAPIMRSMTLRFGCLFLGLALLNELVWRTQSETFWVYYRVVGSMGITFIFIALHIPWLNRRLAESRERMIRKQGNSGAQLLRSLLDKE